MTLKSPEFSSAKVLVFGDIMLDRYWHGSTDRISPEAPVPVVHVQEIREQPGGAGNVALNLASLGTQTVLVGMIGDDVAGTVLRQSLRQANISDYLHEVPGHHTITKLRVLSVHQQLIRLDFEDAFDGRSVPQTQEAYQAQLPSAGAVILSDYGKGTLTGVRELIEQARQQGVPVLVDPKGKDFRLYERATLLTPNLKEFELVVGPCQDEQQLVEKARKALDDHQLEALLVTQGAQGMTLIQRGEEPYHLPAKAREVFDVTGAGDTVISVLTATLAAGGTLQQGMALANVAAGIVVGKLGAATVTVEELQQALHQPQAISSGVVTEDTLMKLLDQTRANGARIVMTNGCFDILHPGHVAYLNEAARLGDRLIIAVNDDASVSQLKGPSRPINALADRMAVLAGLEAVAWVVPFSEETPARLIEKIMPDVLVKGGDYKVEEIAGAKAVLEAGGQVEILPFVDGCSTTKLIARIKKKGEIA